MEAWRAEETIITHPKLLNGSIPQIKDLKHSTLLIKDALFVFFFVFLGS